MKTRILMTGKKQGIYDFFFSYMADVYECQSTSQREEDIMSHIKYFKPEVMVWGIQSETRFSVNRICMIKHRLEEMGIPLVVMGDTEECEKYTGYATVLPDLLLESPIAATEAKEEIGKLLQKKATDIIEDKEDAVTVENELEEESRNAEPQRADKKKHVLVVDDDVRMLKLIKRHLEEEYEVAMAISGKLAMRFLEKNVTDLILLDYEMPEESGADVLEKIRKDKNLQDTPVIFLTGVSEREKIQKVLQLKPNGYLLKPIEREKLLEIIEHTLV